MLMFERGSRVSKSQSERRDREKEVTDEPDMMKKGRFRMAVSLIAVPLAGATLLFAAFPGSRSSEAEKPIAEDAAGRSGGAPPYRSSVVGTDFDFITAGDPSAFDRLEYVGFKDFEMPDKRGIGKPLVQKAHVFEAYFTDGTKVGIALDQEFGGRQAAEQDALKYAPRIGKLPPLYRRNLKHVVVHKGGVDTTAFAEDKGHFFILYSDNAAKRIGTNDLEETIFHEATHASIQVEHLGGAAWNRAKELDDAYITDYAKTEEGEDFAESALFAYTLIHYPERFPAVERAKIEKQIPNRIAFFRRVYSGQ